MYAAIDFGNTQSKVGYFKADQLLSVHTFIDDQKLLQSVIAQKISHLIVSNVGKSRLLLVNELRKLVPLFEFTHQSRIPIQNKYSTPKSLGVDRLAAVIGASTLFPNEASLVIDLGTCITYDFITKDKEYLGGGISPGMWLRNKSMNAYTANLPLIDNFKDAQLIGNSTESCLRSGIVYGIAFEIDGLIDSYQKSFGIFNTVMCGGDAIFFESKVKASIFVRQEIVLLGLYEVLKLELASKVK